jgi:hypothetical protein
VQCAGRVAISPDLRFEVKEAGEIDVVSMALVAAIGTGLPEPPDVAPRFAARSLCVRRAGRAGALRELLG